jgi:undecaprenyl-diphosphatase
MSIFQSIILGLVQGVTEFLPISSSAHLFLLPKILGWQDFPLVFDTSLHIGTLLAVLIYFFKDFLKLDKKMFLYLICGSLPVMVVGFLFGDAIESIITPSTSVILHMTMNHLWNIILT